MYFNQGKNKIKAKILEFKKKRTKITKKPKVLNSFYIKIIKF